MKRIFVCQPGIMESYSKGLGDGWSQRGWFYPRSVGIMIVAVIAMGDAWGL